MSTSTPPPLPQEDAAASEQLFTVCPTCGSGLSYKPGTATLACNACGGSIDIAAVDDRVEEHSLDAWVAANPRDRILALGEQVLTCQGCGATTDTVDLAGSCQFCGGNLISVTEHEGVIKPEAVVPFTLSKAEANAAVSKWVKSRWFAPNALKKIAGAEKLTGTYVPHWTYDSATSSSYTGERGDYYYVTKTRTVSDGKGGTKTETYQERKTRWSNASGRVARNFDDVTVAATARIDEKKLRKITPQGAVASVPFQPEYLAGYAALRYEIGPQDGALTARRMMDATIRSDVERDIGGDEQRVHSVNTQYANNVFKLILAPVWLAAYMYGGKQWQVFVNAHTGEVEGERPWSKAKIFGLIGFILGLILAVVGVLYFLGATAEEPVAPTPEPAYAMEVPQVPDEFLVELL